MTAEACNCDAADKLADCRMARHWLNEDILRLKAQIRHLESEIRRLETEVHR